MSTLLFFSVSTSLFTVCLQFPCLCQHFLLHVSTLVCSVSNAFSMSALSFFSVSTLLRHFRHDFYDMWLLPSLSLQAFSTHVMNWERLYVSALCPPCQLLQGIESERVSLCQRFASLCQHFPSPSRPLHACLSAVCRVCVGMQHGKDWKARLSAQNKISKYRH